MSQKFVNGDNLKRAVDYIKDGTIVAGKATADAEGNNINNTFVKHNTYDGTLSVKKADEADEAKSLATSVGITDQTPFSEQTTGGSSDITTGIQNLNKLIGCKVVKNQWRATHTGTINLVEGGQYQVLFNFTSLPNPSGCKFLIWGKVDYSSAPSCDTTQVTINVSASGHSNYISTLVPITNGRFYKILDLTYADSSISIFALAQIGSTFGSGESVSYDDANGTMLTLRYGSNDVVNAIIGSDTSKYVANLIAFDPNILKDTDYDTGSFSECKSASLESVEYNLLADDWTVTGNNVAYVEKTLTEPIICTGQVIALVATVTGAISPLVSLYSGNTQIAEFFLYNTADGQKCGRGNYPDTDYALPIGTKITKIRFRYDGAGGTSGNFTYSKIAVFNYWDGSRVGYEPYKKHSIPLPNVDLNGILKVVNGKVVADGDELTPDGSGNAQRYGVVDLGTLNWNYDGSIFTVNLPTAKYYDRYTVANIVCAKYTRVARDIIDNKQIAISPSGGTPAEFVATIFAKDSSYTDATTFKTAMSGVYLIYELATPESLEADNFSSTFYGDDFGVMRFLDENDNVIDGLQGNEIFYKANVGGFAESLYIKTDGDPDDLVVQSDLTPYDNKDTQLLNAIGGTLRQCLCVKESLTFNNTKVVDMGDLEYVYDSGYQAFRSVNLSDNAPVGDRTHSIVLSTLYETVDAKYSSQLGNLSNMCMCQTLDSSGTNPNIWIKNTSYTDVTTFKNAMKGVLLAYEKASE